MKPDFAVRLMEWNRQSNRREMPWKGIRDPYRIWLSEIILQQTRVEQGRKYYEAFIAAFPTINDLAAASEQEVFKLWEGLGYYSRCRNLLVTARYISLELNGDFPDSYEEILKLKGVGPYTAAAIASFAFNHPVAVVDGNVQRVISRYFGINTPVDTVSGKKLYQQLAQSLIEDSEPALYNQAIMDFGAQICKPQQPLCSGCVQQDDCQAFKLGVVNELPVKEKSISKKERWFTYFIIENDCRVLFRKRTEKDIWQELYEFVLLETESVPHQHEIDHFLQRVVPDGYSILSQSKVYRQVLSHQIINARFTRVSTERSEATPDSYNYISKKELGNFAFPRIINSYLEEGTI